MNDNLENNLGDSGVSENSVNGLNTSQPNEMVMKILAHKMWRN